jgi:hypothetical protein
VLTKKINIGQHRQSLPFSQLPATLRDAINLTKKLVYYNASLVLAANTSGDCTLGLNQEHLFGSRAWQRSFVPFIGLKASTTSALSIQSHQRVLSDLLD